MSVMAGLSGVHRVTALQVLALVPPVLVTFWADPAGMAVVFLAAGIAALFWEGVFAQVRGRRPSIHGLTTALIVTVLLPGDIAVWQIAVAVSLGVILGELIFGGRGFGFVAPATVVLALVSISFPDVVLVSPGRWVAVATVPGLVLLVWRGFLSPAVLVAGAAAALGLMWPVADPVVGLVGLTFGLVFLIADPVAAPVTHPGRWVYGALAGGLVALFATGGVMSGEAVVFAALLAGVFAPLIDAGAVRLDAARRRRRAHG